MTAIGRPIRTGTAVPKKNPVPERPQPVRRQEPVRVPEKEPVKVG